MFRSLKILFCLLLAAASASSAHAFSLLGPYADWQVSRIGYNVDDDIGGPMLIEEEYRWNVPVITYGFDESFVNYFGPQGIAAIEQAIQILNDLPPASQITPSMVAPETSVFPPYVAAENPTASALSLMDLKSTALSLLVEQMGLAEAERFVYTIRARTVVGNPAITNWSVIMMNYDPVTLQPTNLINNVFYTYYGIVRQLDPDIDWTLVQPITIEPNAGTVASGFASSLSLGMYYPGTNATTALTRDDVGGLRYLYRPTNSNVERLLPGIEEVFTNTINPLILTNYDLGLLIQMSQATTNTPAQIENRFPGIQLTSTNSYLTNYVITNITSYFTNFPYPLLVDLEQVFVTNYTTNITQLFTYTFGNIITNEVTTTRIATERIYDVIPAPDYTPGGSAIRTNIISEVTGTTNLIGGSFYIKPTNYIDIVVLSNSVSLVDSTTNIISTAFSQNVAVTNATPPPFALTTLDYHDLYKNTRNTTNTLDDLLEIYPDLLVTETNSYLGVLVTTNITTYFTNYPWRPRQVFVTNYTSNVVSFYNYTLGNVVFEPLFGGSLATDRPITIITNQITLAPDYTPGMDGIRTNTLGIEHTWEFADEPDEFFGEFFIVPTNLLGYAYISNVHTSVTNATNIDYFAIADMMVRTNTDQLIIVPVYDLAWFEENVRTNSPTEIASLLGDPALLILSSNRYFTNIVSSNYVSYFTNSPWDPAGTLIVTQQWFFATNIATNYNYVFGNVVTNFGSQDPVNRNGVVIIDETLVGAPPYSPGGSPALTNFTRRYELTNSAQGSVYIVDTNYFGYDIQSTQLVDVVAITNTLVYTNFDAQGIEQTNVTHIIRYATNYYLTAYPIEFLNTNDFGTNFFGTRREVITYHTNTTYEVYPIVLMTTNDLGTNIFGRKHEVVTYFTNTLVAFYPVQSRPPLYNVGYRPGVDKVNFVRIDDLVVTNQLNITNTYVDVVVTNIGSAPVYQTLRRVVTGPDILFAAADLGTHPRTAMPIQVVRNPPGTSNWENNNDINGQAGLAGPGVIRPQVFIRFSKVGGPFRNRAQTGNQSFQDFEPLLRWASFDSSTNIVVYPVGTSISDLEQEVLTP